MKVISSVPGILVKLHPFLTNSRIRIVSGW